MEGPRVRISVPPIWVEHCAPRVFTKILIPVMALLRRNGLRAIVFLDDMLLLAQSMTLLRTPPAAVGFHCQLGEVSPHSISGIDIPGVCNQLMEDADKLVTKICR